MPLLLDENQRQIAQEAERILADGFSPERLKTYLETTGAYDDAYWTACREMGWPAITIDEAHGGLGIGPIELCLTAQATGRYAVGAPFLVTNYGASEALRLYGGDDISGRWLPRLADGSAIGALWLPERGRPVPRLTHGGLNDRIGPVAAGLHADILITPACDEASGRIVLTFVELSGSMRRTPVQTFDNARGYAELELHGAPATILAEDGRGTSLALGARMAVVMAFEQLGLAEACMERARLYANEREAFGQPIGKFQAIKHRIAEMYVANELARGAALRAALALRDDAPDLVLRAAGARLLATEAAGFAAREAMQTHGAIGVTWEHDLHLFYRRAEALRLELGVPTVWEDIATRLILEERAA